MLGLKESQKLGNPDCQPFDASWLYAISGFCGTQWNVGKGASIGSAFELLNLEISVYEVPEHVCEESSPPHNSRDYEHTLTMIFVLQYVHSM